MDANLKATLEKMAAAHKEMITHLDAAHKRRMSCLGNMEVTDFKANPEEMQAKVEHREVPKEHAAVENGREPNEQHRGWNLAAECHRKPKDGSWNKLTAASRMTHHGMALGKCQEKSDQGQHGMRDLEMNDIQEELSAKTRMQKWDKKPMPETAALLTSQVGREIVPGAVVDMKRKSLIFHELHILPIA